MNAPRRVQGNFPDYGWAWPRGALDQLLRAVVSPDDGAALAAGLDWLDRHDIDVVGFREHRLLAALSNRFGKQLAPSSTHPRLMGLQRKMWSRSRMALRDSHSALSALAESEIPFIVIKGASRVALDPKALRARASHDIDILVRSADMVRSFDQLIKHGWQASSGAGALRLVASAATYRAMNFFNGDYGDVDVHQAAYQTSNFDPDDEDALWRRSVAARLDGVAARVPAPSDRIAIAIAHGALDGHTHSDWIVDIVDAISAADVDWDALEVTIARRRLVVPAASVMTYLAQALGVGVPPDFLRRLVDAADAAGFRGRLSLFECKPRDDLGTLFETARSVAKRIRFSRSRPSFVPSAGPLWRTRIALPAAAPPKESMKTEVTIPVTGARKLHLKIALVMMLPRPRRRVEMELSTPSRHLALLRYRKLRRYAGARKLVFRGTVELDEQEERLILSACAVRFMRRQDAAFEARYGALPFAIQSISAT